MKEVNINGLPLPEILLKLISDGIWKKPNESLIKELGIEDLENLAFLSLEEMQGNTDELHSLSVDDEWKDVLRLSSIEFNSFTPQGYLNVSKAVVIAVTTEDEYLCLDYSISLQPRVVATLDRGAYAEWVVIADSFDSFVEKLKLQ